MLTGFRLSGEAVRMLRQSVDLYAQLGDEVGYARSRNDLANGLLELGREREAEEIYTDNLERARRLENRVLQANALLNLGELRRRERRAQEAVALLREATELSREMNELSGVSLDLNNLGLALEQAGDEGRARQAFEESLRGASEDHDEAAAARALSSLGSAALALGELARPRNCSRRPWCERKAAERGACRRV